MSHVPTIGPRGPGQPSRGRFRGLPSTIPGSLSLLFVAAFVALFAAANVVVATGQEGGETIFSNLWISTPMLGALGSALTAGALAAFVVIRRHERSLAVLATLVFGLVVLAFVVGEATTSH